MADTDTARLTGVMVPAVTPFDEHGAVDLAAVEANQAFWARSGLAGTMALGSNGECRSLSDSEALDVVRAVSARSEGKTLVVGAGRESVDLTLRFIDRLSAVPGIDAAAVLTPHYFADLMTDRALVAYYTEVADRSALPVLVYVAPKFANGVAPSVQAVADLADHPRICGIKESDPGRLVAHLSGGPRPDFAVLAGSVGSLLACLDAGGAGGIVSAANYLPDRCARVAALHAAGDRDRAVEELRQLRDVAARTAGSYGVAGVKACMTLRGLAGGLPRRPVLPVDATAVAQMRAELATQGLL